MLEIPLWGQILMVYTGFRPFRYQVINKTPNMHFLHRKHVLRATIDLSAVLRIRAVREPKNVEQRHT